VSRDHDPGSNLGRNAPPIGGVCWICLIDINVAFGQIIEITRYAFLA